MNPWSKKKIEDVVWKIEEIVTELENLEVIEQETLENLSDIELSYKQEDIEKLIELLQQEKNSLSETVDNLNTILEY